jgi:hypothetical protein
MHLDSHMGSLFVTPEITALTWRLRTTTGFRFWPSVSTAGAADAARRERHRSRCHHRGEPEVAANRWKEFYVTATASLKPGLTAILVHLGRVDAELQAVMVNSQTLWRGVASAGLRRRDKRRPEEGDQGLRRQAVTWRDLQKAVKP